MVNLVFIHGINSQTTGYSNQLLDNIKREKHRGHIEKNIGKT